VFGRILVTLILALALNEAKARNTRPRPEVSRPRPRPENLASRPRPNNPAIGLSLKLCLVPFSSYLTLNNIVTLKSGLGVTQGH